MQSNQPAARLTPSSEQSPYVGPRPFTTKDRDIFFGRNQEAIELTSLVKAHPEVLLYAQSGAGKTSLLFAQVIPILDTEEDFDVLPPARVRSQESSRIPDEKIDNIYMFNALKDLSDDQLSVIERSQFTLADYLNRRPRPAVTVPDGAENGHEGGPELRIPRVVIFDQFEEIFTLHPERYKDRQDFFIQVSDALKDDPFLRIVFSMREDYIAEVDPYVDILPQSLRTRFRLERLRNANAVSAVKQPLQTERVKTNRKFADGAAEMLVEKLMMIKVKTASGDKIEVPGEFVDPVQLQVVCQTLWNKLPTAKAVITKEDIDKYANVDEALSDFYETSVRKAVTASNKTIEAGPMIHSGEMQTITEGMVRGWFEQKLITREGKRNMVFREAHTTAGLSNLVVDELENQHVIRVEMRGGEPWYELSHDRFIPPIRESNRRFLLQQPLARRKALELEARAGEWLKSQRNDKLLLNRAELLDAQNWMRTEAAAIGHTETLFSLIQASEAAIQHEDNEQQRILAEAQQLRVLAEQQRGRQLKLGLVLASVLLLFTVASTGIAINRWRSARVNYHRAEAALADATTQKNLAEQSARDLAAANIREGGLRKDAEDALALANNERAAAEAARTQTEVALADAKAAKAQTDVALADVKTAKAEAERSIVQLQEFQTILNDSRDEAWSLKLASNSEATLMSDPELSLRLALNALKQRPNHIPDEAKNMLRRSYQKFKERSILRGLEEVNWEATYGRKKIDVWRAAYGPDGRVITISEDGTARIWDPETKKEVSVLRAGAPVHAFAINPDGTRLATEEMDEKGRIWNLRDGTFIELAGLTGPVAALTLSPDGKLLVTEATDNPKSPGAAPRIWDVETGKNLATLRGHGQAVVAISFNREGNWIATASWDSTARIWDAKTGREIAALRGHTAPLTSVAFDGTGQLVVTSSFDGTARVWDAATGKEKFTLSGHEGVVSSAAFSPDNGRIVTAGREVSSVLKADYPRVPLPPEIANRFGIPDNTARIWDARTGKLVDILKGHCDSVNSAMFSSDGKNIVTSSKDGTAIVWDARTGENLIQLEGHGRPVVSAVFGPGDTTILTASEDGTAQIWRWNSIKQIQFDARQGSILRTDLRSDGSMVISDSYGNVHILDSNQIRRGVSPGAKPLQISSIPAEAAPTVSKTAPASSPTLTDSGPAEFWDVAMSPSAEFVVTGSRTIMQRTGQRVTDTHARVWDIRKGQFRRDDLTGHKQPVTKVLFSPQGRYVLTMSDDIVRVWETSTWTAIRDLQPISPTSGILDAAFEGGEESAIIAHDDGSLLISKLTTGENKSVRLQDGRLLNAAFNSTGNLVATVSAGTMGVRVWNVIEGNVSKLQVEGSRPDKIAFSSDDSLILLASFDGTIRVMETSTGKPITELRLDEPMSSLALDAANSFIVAGDMQGAVHVIDCIACRPFEVLRNLADESKPRELTSDEIEKYMPNEKRSP